MIPIAAFLHTDIATNYVHVEPQVSFTAHETLEATAQFETHMRDLGVVVQANQFDNGPAFTSMEFQAKLAKRQTNLNEGGSWGSLTKWNCRTNCANCVVDHQNHDDSRSHPLASTLQHYTLANGSLACSLHSQQAPYPQKWTCTLRTSHAVKVGAQKAAGPSCLGNSGSTLVTLLLTWEICGIFARARIHSATGAQPDDTSY
jgi:hypothetical protein